MCRSIKVLRGQEDVTIDDIEAAALQYVRKIAGMRKPSKKNEEAFEAAVLEITQASERLLGSIEVATNASSIAVASASTARAPRLRMTPRA